MAKPTTDATTRRKYILLVGVLLLISGCESDSERVWKMAYHASYQLAYRAALSTTSPGGQDDGRKNGESEAREAARTGPAIALYTPLISWGVIPGVVLGMLIQYAILFTCQMTKSLPGFLAIAFVPAFNRSQASSIFQRRLQQIVEFNDEIDKINASRALKIAKVDAAYEATKRKILAASQIEELTEARIVQIAKAEFERIVADAEETHHNNGLSRLQPVSRTGVYQCPYCRKNVKYPRKLAGGAIECPHSKCGRLIVLPPKN